MKDSLSRTAWVAALVLGLGGYWLMRSALLLAAASSNRALTVVAGLYPVVASALLLGALVVQRTEARQRIDRLKGAYLLMGTTVVAWSVWALLVSPLVGRSR